MYLTTKSLYALVVGILLGAVVVYSLLREGGALHPQHDHGVHPIGQSTDTEVHVHADFLMYVNDNRIRFTDQKYQSDGDTIHHALIHFHGGKDDVIHRHADGVTLVTFLQSLGFDLNSTCLTTDTKQQYCNKNENEVRLIVNGERVMDIKSYVIAEEDKILVYYGDITSPNIREYITNISEEACIYSGTCPERGVPPPENCGLTCEVTDFKDTSPWWWQSLW